jgi:hypothetical protein
MSSPLTDRDEAWSVDVMPDCSPRSKLADDSSRWLHEYPAHRVRTWRWPRVTGFPCGRSATTTARSKKRIVLATNVAMLRLARSMDFSVNAEPADAAVLRIRRDLAARNTQLH